MAVLTLPGWIDVDGDAQPVELGRPMPAELVEGALARAVGDYRWCGTGRMVRVIAAAEANPASRHDAITSRRVHDWIQNDLRAWAYAHRRGDLWAVFVPEFSIATQAATREAAFAQANKLLVDYFIGCLDANITFDQSARPLPRRNTSGMFSDQSWQRASRRRAGGRPACTERC